MNKLIKLAGVLLFVSSITLPVLPAFAAPKAPAVKEPKVVKIKGFYIGMDIEEAKNKIVELFNDKEAVIEELIESGEKSYFIKNVNRLKKRDLESAKIVPIDVEKVWKALINTGYINESGRIQDKFFAVTKPEQLEFAPGSKEESYGLTKIALYDIFKAAGMQPKYFHIITADSDKKVNYIYFSGNSSDRLFNTEGIPPTQFAYNFVKAYLFVPDTFDWPAIDPQKVIKLWEYRLKCTVIIYSDKSFVMQKLTDVNDFKFD